MNIIMKRLLCLTLSLLMITAVLPMGIMADSSWTVTASNTWEWASLEGAIDGDAESRWTNGRQDPDDFTINFGEEKTINNISILCKGDYAQGCVVSTSTDGTTWTEVTSSYEISDDKNYQIISLSQSTTTQYLKIKCTQTRTDGYYWWSIYEIELNSETAGSGEETDLPTFTSGGEFEFTPSDYYTGTDNFYDYINSYKSVQISVTFEADGYFNGAIWANLGNGNFTQEYHEAGSGTSTWTSEVTLIEDTAKVLMWTIGEGTTYAKITGISVTVVEEEPAIVEPDFYGWALTLDGKIGVTYYFDMTDVTNADEYVLNATIGERTASVTHGESKTDGGATAYYRYTVYVSVSEINATIKATLDYGDVSVTVDDYSVATYCNTAIDGNLAEKTLCEALLTYGYYTGVYNGMTTGITDTYKLANGYTVNISDDTFGSTVTTTTGFAKKLLLSEVIYIRVYMIDYQEVVVNGVTYTPVENKEESGYYYSFDFPVSAQNLSKMYEICDTEGNALTKYSVYSYILNNYTDTETSGLADLCKAIYNYGEAAKNYTGWH